MNRYLIPALAALLVAWTPGIRLVQLVAGMAVCNLLLWALHDRSRQETEA